MRWTILALVLLAGCSTNRPSRPVFRSVVVPPAAPRIVIPITCQFTNGYVYLAVSTDLVNWGPFDTNIYDASLPRIPGDTITNFVRPDMPVRFAKYAQTNWPPDEYEPYYLVE